MTLVAGVLSGMVRLAEEEEPFDLDSVTPGVVGFLATAAFALAVILLALTLVRRLRRNAYRHEAREQIAEELAARDGAENGDRAESAGGSADERPAGDR